MQVPVSLMVNIPATADINQIETLIQQAGQQAMRAATQQAVRVAEEQRKSCPYCGSEIVRGEGTDRRIVLTKFGRVVLALRRLRCQACRRRFRPAEECLKGLQGGNVTAALCEACAEAGARLSLYLHEDQKHLVVPKKLGHLLKIKLHRPTLGTPKTVHLVLRADGHWYALIVCETEPRNEPLPSTCSHPDIGIDVGLKSFLTDSEGNTIANPRFYSTSQKGLRRKQRQLSRRKKGSKRFRKASKNVAKTHLKINRQRRDHHFKAAKPYALGYGRIAVEDLAITNMVKNHHLSKSILDASWGAFLDILEEKAARAGHQVIRVNPRYTTQACSHCGELIQKSLSVRTHICTSCGFVADRDVNAAKNILFKARAWPSGTAQDAEPVELRSPRL